MAEDQADPLDERIIENVLTELRAQNALADLHLDDDVLQTLAWAVAVNLDYAFSIEWAPRWEKARPRRADRADVRVPQRTVRVVDRETGSGAFLTIGRVAAGLALGIGVEANGDLDLVVSSDDARRIAEAILAAERAS